MHANIKILFLVVTILAAPLERVFAQASGVVVDDDGEPIPGASVKVKGSSTGVNTDLNGRFQLGGVTPGETLIFSFVGTQPVSAKAKTGMKVTLTENKALDEVLVTAFGEQTRSSFTGSASVVNEKKIQQRQLTNVLGALDGEAAGVQMVNNSGDPNSTPTIRIRGFSSLNAGNDPLIIVDGAPYDGDWNSINPQDVASVTVLKDAASAALYGARGANGIIMVTTKKAQMGKSTVTLDAKWGGSQRIARDYETINNIPQFYETYYNALYNYYSNYKGLNINEAHSKALSHLESSTGGGLGYMVLATDRANEDIIGLNGKVNPNSHLGNLVTNNGKTYMIYPDNWMDKATRGGFRQEYNLSANGGNSDMQYYASFGYLNNKGVTVGSDFERYNGRLKANAQVAKWLRVGVNGTFTHSLSGYVSNSDNNIFNFCQSIAPIYPVYIRDAGGNIMTDANGQMYDYGSATGALGLVRPYQRTTNPIQSATLDTYRGRTNTYTFGGNIDVTPLSGLKISLNATLTGEDRMFSYAYNPFYGWSSTSYTDGYIQQGTDKTFSYNIQQLINYKKSFGKHNMELLLGHENYQQKYDYLWAAREGLASYFTNQTISGAVIDNSMGGQSTNYNTEGVFFRGMYDYDGKYYGSVSVRGDASSRFAPGHRWGAFFSVGGAWIMTKETFMQPTAPWLDMLKLKLSFGQVGNDAIGEHRYEDVYSIVNSDGHSALQLKSKGNIDITWETVNNVNAGVEFELFKGRLTGGIEYFWRKTSDMLCFIKAPLSAGYTGQYKNIGDMVNQGAEITLSGSPIRTKDLEWKINANATFYKNKITRLASSLTGGVAEDGYTGSNGIRITNGSKIYCGYSNGGYFIGEGLPMYSWYMREYAGVNSEGLSTWYITNSDGTRSTTTDYTKADDYICGSPHPTVYGGFGTSLSWKGLDVSITFTYSLGGKAYDYGYATLMTVPTSSSYGTAIHQDVLNAWSESNQSTDIPRWQYGDMNTTALSSRFLTSASQLTLSNINIGYTLPKNLTKKAYLSSVRLYLAADNLYYWTARRGFDPRGSFNGQATTNTYSPTRTISGGITVTY